MIIFGIWAALSWITMKFLPRLLLRHCIFLSCLQAMMPFTKGLRNQQQPAIQVFAPNEPQFLQYYKANEAKKLANPIWCLGAKDILKRIVASGSRNFLISHRDHQVNDLLEQAGLLGYFTEVVTASNGFARKPNPESLLYLKEKYLISKGLVIGDRRLDIEAGQAAGFDTLLVDGRKNLLEIVD
ncbi:hydrolase HAD family [Streptococcus equi subsp. zooepidemicus MGCS10565]|uniref:Hydrolase HAD family n=1 Tax=Streptococcus equi subsp. zooepidemicus (strain MGCS10565) TaxID=552526 RepID=B4U2B2_STREM|nr:hydrolase HAD family [Streptococcus equi subsp. zooepidemicus MGCS10565]